MSAIFDFNKRVTITGAHPAKADREILGIELVVTPPKTVNGVDVAPRGYPPGFFLDRDISSRSRRALLGKTVTAEASCAYDGSTRAPLRTMMLPNHKFACACP